MPLNLSGKFHLSLDHIDNQIEISDFGGKGGKLKHIICRDLEIGKFLIRAMLNLYQDGYGESRYLGTLTDSQKQNLYNAFTDTTYNGSYKNKLGMIPEMLLQIYRSFATNSYIKDIKGLHGTTQVGDDYFEILFDGQSYLSLFRDARSDITNNPKGAIINKIKELGEKKWNLHIGLVDKLDIQDELKKKELKEKIHTIPNQKIIFVVSEGEIKENNVGIYSSYIEFLLAKTRKSSGIYKTLQEIMNKGNYIPYYALVQINNYGKIIKEEIVGDDNENGRKFINQIDIGNE